MSNRTNSIPLLWIAACSLSTLGSSVQAQREALTLPVFEDGQAQVVEGFSDRKSWIQHDLWVECKFDSDGDGQPDRVHVGVTRPEQTETEGLRVPVVYETSPYFSGVARGSDFFWDPEHELGSEPPVRADAPEIPNQSKRPSLSRSLIRIWVPRGFAVVHSASPGTGLSQGCPTVGGINESLAPEAVIDWLNGRAKGYTTPDGDEQVVASWCTGKVGMTGTSYNGTLPLAAATTGVEGLEAIIPVAPNTSYYHYYRSNGLVRHPGGYMGEDIDVLYDFIHSGPTERRPWCDEHVRDGLMNGNQDRVTGDYNEFWASRDYLNAISGVRAATLIAHGLNDWNVMPSHSVRVYEALKQNGTPAMIFLHQGGHGGDPTPEMMNRWFTRYLYDVENDVENDPRAWIVREGAKRSDPTPYAEYPNPAAAPVLLHLSGDGNQVGSLATAPTAAEPQSLVDDVSVTGAELASADKSKHRLLFASEELRSPLHLSGTARLKVRLASSAPAANLSVWVVSLPWETGASINDNLITRGWADPQNHRSLEKSEALQPGNFYELAFDLEPDDQVIPAGQRIGLMIFSSDRDFTLWPEPGTELTVDPAGTLLELPVVGGAAGFEAAVGSPSEHRSL